MIDQYFYARDYTRRKLKRQVSFAIGAVVIFALGGISTVLLGLYGLTAVPAAIQSFVKELTALGAWLNLSSDFATIVIAEILAIGGMSLIARIFRGKKQHIGPYIVLSPKLLETDTEGVKHYKVIVSNEEGTRTAISCQATIIFNEIEKRDILRVQTAKLNPDNFTSTIKTDLSWEDGAKEYTLRSGDDTEIEVLRLVPAREGIEAHFEIPSRDEHWGSVVCLNLKTSYPKVKVVPFNGKHETRSFTLERDRTEARNWVLS
jgi:hypothetical protein